MIPSQYSVPAQARLIPALCALHNFIHAFDPMEIEEFHDMMESYSDSTNPVVSTELEYVLVTAEECMYAEQFRDEIAQAMWAQYWEMLAKREWM
jgi:hypothetical protein